MALDKEPVQVSFALMMAKAHYPEDKYNHALRVMQYVAENDMIPFEYKEECVSLAIMHDLMEDTQYTGSGLPENFYKALKLLARPKDQEYAIYIKNIKDTCFTNWRMCAYWVKLADMKDHLTQTETLTDSLKKRYMNALAILL
jgi:hypothetical protein